MGSDSVKLRHHSFHGIVNVTCPLDLNKCRFVHWTNRNIHWTFKCPFVQWTNRNVHWTSKYPFVHWTNGHCLMASTLVSCPHGVRLSQITSLQLPWHRKRYMSIGHIINVHSSIGRTEMSIGHSNLHSSIGQREMSIGHSYLHLSRDRTEMSIGHKYMSIGPLDEQKCLLDIQMSIRPMDQLKCPLEI